MNRRRSSEPGRGSSAGRNRGGKQGPGKGGRDQRGRGERRSDGRSGSNRSGSARGGGGRGGSNRGGSGRGGNRKPIKGLGGDQVEGRQAVRELLLAGRRNVREVLVIDDLAPAEILTDIAELCADRGVPHRLVSRKRLLSEAITDSHQGVMARAANLPEADLEELMSDSGAFLLVLDGVTDPGNLGAMLRTAECAGVTGVILGRHRSVRVTAAVTKTAAGAVEHVPMAVVGGIPTVVKDLSDRGIFTVGLDEGGTASIFDLPSDGRPIALVLGAEGKGLSRLVRDRVDVVASIPMGGHLNSLNVAMAAGVACFEVVRSRLT